MAKSRILIIALTAMFMLAFVAGCSLAANAKTGTKLPNSDELVVSTEHADTVVDGGIETTPLGSEELAYFNGDSFFNGEYLNIRNQFLSSLYSAPEEIDLFQLFYCGTGLSENSVTEKEKAAVADQNGLNIDHESRCEKNSAANMDAVLTKYIGLTLAETKKVGLENMTYLDEYDAYYTHHGDTNYRGFVTFTAGEREGSIIRLFYDDTFFGDGKKVLTLQEKGDDYLFVSNQLID